MLHSTVFRWLLWVPATVTVFSVRSDKSKGCRMVKSFFLFLATNQPKKIIWLGFFFFLNFLSSHGGLHTSENLWEPANLLTGYELLKECDEEPSLLRGSNNEVKIHDVPSQAASCQTRNHCAQPPNPFRPPSADATLSRRFSMDGGGRGGRKEQGHLPADASPQC